jgi:hypothetical protein
MTPAEAISEIRRGLDLLYQAGDVVELRAFRQNYFKTKGKDTQPTTISGYFDDLNQLALAIHEVNSFYKNGKETHISVFVTLNPVKPSWQALTNKVYWGSGQLQKEIVKMGLSLVETTRMTAHTKFKTYYSMRTSDESDILSRRWILLDVDSGQPAGANSSDAEKATAFEMLGAITRFLHQRGFPAMAICDSGNGWHGLLRVHLPNTAETTDTVRRFLKAIAKEFDNQYGRAHLDITVFNVARIVKAYGSIVFKGAHSPERPCRCSRVISTENALCPSELIVRLADGFEPPSAVPSYAAAIGDAEQQKQVEKLIAYLDYYDIEYQDAIVADGWVRIPCTCPNEAMHTTEGIETSTMASVSQGGAFGFVCRHSHCDHLSGWQNFKAFNQKMHPGEPPFEFEPAGPLAYLSPLPEPKEPEWQQPSIVVLPIQTTLDKAVALLNEVCQPMCLVKEVNRLAAERGLKPTTLRRASKMLGLITSYADRSGAMLVKAPTWGDANKLVRARRKAG